MCHYVKLNNNSKFDERLINLVDNGTWALFYGSSTKDKRIKYALNTGDEYFFLDINGIVIYINKNKDGFKQNDIARFSKIKHTMSI